VSATPTTNGLVGLLLVSHSAAIADGLAEFVGQVAGPDVAIVAAGGGPDGTLGTDGGRVLDGLRSLAGGAGGVVLMDLGSSVLSVRAALQELDESQSEQIVVVDAPFVEGAIAAGVAASIGGSRDDVAAAALEARGASKL
jgi:PTS hybrid protein